MRSLGLAALILATACTPGRVDPAAPPITTNNPDSLLPRTVGAFHFVEQHVYEERNAGYSYRYDGPGGVWADVYRYPIRMVDERCDEACGARAAQEEMDTYVTGIVPELNRRGVYGTVTVVRQSTIKMHYRGKDRRVRHVVLTVEGPKLNYTSHQLLVADRSSMFKVRFSTPGLEDRGGSVAAARSFTQGLLEGIRPEYTCHVGRWGGDPVAMDVTFDRMSPEQLREAVPGVLEGLGYRVHSVEAEPSIWFTEPRFSRPAGREETGPAAAHPGVQVVVVVQGDTAAHVSVQALALCDLGRAGQTSGDTRRETTLELLSSMEVMAGLKDAGGGE